MGMEGERKRDQEKKGDGDFELFAHEFEVKGFQNCLPVVRIYEHKWENCPECVNVRGVLLVN